MAEQQHHMAIAEDDQDVWDRLKQYARDLRDATEGSPMTTDADHTGYDIHGYYVWVWPKTAGDSKNEMKMIRLIEKDGIFRYCVGAHNFRSAQSAICAAAI